MKESDLKSTIKGYLLVRGIFNYHLLQGMGSYKGLPDMEMHYKGEVHYLEIKLPKGVLSEWQKNFQAQCKQDRVHYHVIRSLEDLLDIIGIGE